MLGVLFSVIRRDLLMALRRRSGIITPLVFFSIVITLFPLSLSGGSQQLAEYAPSAIWVTVLLSGFLSLEYLLKPDYQNGTLGQFIIMPQSLGLVIFGKIIAHWLINGVSLSLLAPIYTGLLFLPSKSVIPTMLALLLGTGIVSLIGAIAAALTVSLRQGGILTGLLVMPFYLPPLIFGVQIIEASVLGLPILGYFAVLGAMLVFAIPLAPFFAAAALKVILD